MPAVLDAAGSDTAALLGLSEGGPMSILFAATSPMRTSPLILYGTFARFMEAPDYPFGTTPDMLEHLCGPALEDWGEEPASHGSVRRWTGTRTSVGSRVWNGSAPLLPPCGRCGA